MKIGLYDSGIGGLTTLVPISKEFNCNFLYYADNKNFPLGLKTDTEICSAVEPGIKYLQKNCDFVVLACNTSSCYYKSNHVFRLLPYISNMVPQKTLVLATPGTIDFLKLQLKSFLTCDTSLYATLATEFAMGRINRDEIKKFLLLTLKDLPIIPENIVLGCSHYLYLKDILAEIYPYANFYDGNSSLINALKHNCTLNAYKSDSKKFMFSKLEFKFSGVDEKNSYINILKNLLSASL